MRIQLLSDLHLEVERMSNAPDSDRDGDLYKFDFPADPTADALALVGDIGTTNEERLFKWIRAQLARFKIVFFVPGNHEAFHSTMVSGHFLCLHSGHRAPNAGRVSREAYAICC